MFWIGFLLAFIVAVAHLANGLAMWTEGGERGFVFLSLILALMGGIGVACMADAYGRHKKS